MAKRAAGLTARQVATISKPGFHAAGGAVGLYLQVTRGAGRSWVYRFKMAGTGKRRDMGLGPVDAVTLAEARQLATEKRRMVVVDEQDPIEVRRAKRQGKAAAAARTMTFEQCAQKYIAAHRAGWKHPAHVAQWSGSLETYAYPVFGSLPIDTIDTALVMKVLKPIWDTKVTTASRVRGRIENIIDWATTSEFRTGENPARWKGHLKNLLPPRSKVHQVKHFEALPYADMAAFMAELRQQEGIGARALEWAILTVARTDEVLGAPWHEIDFKARTWTIPAERMKTRREHRVPLSDAAMAILEGLPKGGAADLLFPGAKAGQPRSHTVLLTVLHKMNGRGLTAHGFRSTFTDWGTEQTAFPSNVIEMALAHTISNYVEAAYRRGDLFEKRRQLADEWARFCTNDESQNGIVTQLRSVTAI